MKWLRKKPKKFKIFFVFLGKGSLKFEKIELVQEIEMMGENTCPKMLNNGMTFAFIYVHRIL
jgi:hypothetical protein